MPDCAAQADEAAFWALNRPFHLGPNTSGGAGGSAPRGSAPTGAEIPSSFAEHPREDRVDMPGVIAEVEFLVDLILRQRGTHLFVGQQFLAEIGAMSQTFIALRCTSR